MKKSILLILILLIPLFALAHTAGDYLDRGVAKYEKGDYSGAIQDGNKAIVLNPNNANAYGSRAMTCPPYNRSIV